MILFAFPPLTVGLFFLTFDRMFGGNFFDHTMGGNTIIWEHIFWIFGHPEVYILILPCIRYFLEIFSIFSRKRLFGYHCDGICDSTDWFLRIHGLGSPYVYSRSWANMQTQSSQLRRWRLLYQQVLKSLTGCLQFGAVVLSYDSNALCTRFYSIIRNGWSNRRNARGSTT